MIIILVPIVQDCVFYNDSIFYIAFIPLLPKTVTFGMFYTPLGCFFGVDQMSCSPITLYEPPSAGHVYCVPRISESGILELDSRLVSRTFAISDNYITVD